MKSWPYVPRSESYGARVADSFDRFDWLQQCVRLGARTDTTPSIEARIARAANHAANRGPANLDGTTISVASNLTTSPCDQLPIVDQSGDQDWLVLLQERG